MFILFNLKSFLPSCDQNAHLVKYKCLYVIQKCTVMEKKNNQMHLVSGLNLTVLPVSAANIS